MSIRHNLVRNPGAGVDLTDWSFDQVGTPTIVRNVGTGPLGSTTYARVTATATVARLGLVVGSTSTNLVTPGLVYTFSGYVRPVTSLAAVAQAIVVYLDSSGAQVGSNQSGTSVAVAQGTFANNRISVTTTAAPAGAVRAQLFLRVSPTSGSFASGDLVDFGALMLEQTAVLGTFFMGGIGGGVWDGTANSSTSSLFAPEVTITGTIDDAPCPRAEVLITDISPAVATVDVYRLAAGREYLVRGGVKAPVAGALTRIDFEVPFGVAAQYRGEMFDASGASLGFTESGTVTLEVEETWVHNPLDPQGATTVAFRRNALRDIERPLEAETVWPKGRIVGVVIAGQRRGIQDAVLDVIVDTIDQADRLQTMFGDYQNPTTPVACFRIGYADRIRIPKPFFAGIVKFSEQDQNYAIGTGEKIAFAMNGSEVAPPTPALVVPLLTRADLNAAFPTRAALNAFFLTRLDANRAYSFAGTA